MSAKEKITIEDIQKAVENSGYLLEQKLCPTLIENGYDVTTNIPFEDVDTGKSCEFDVSARKRYKVIENNNLNHEIVVHLLLSCKNNHYPVILFSRENIPNIDFSHIGGIINVCFPQTIRNHGPIDIFCRWFDSHHYFQSKYNATQYAICRRKVVMDIKLMEEIYLMIYTNLLNLLFKKKRI
jgi:hypothetical protein